MARWILLATMTVLQLGDFITTLRIKPEAMELNPLIGFGTHPTPLKLAIFKLASIAVFTLLIRRTKRLRVPVLLCVVFAIIVCSNAALDGHRGPGSTEKGGPKTVTPAVESKSAVQQSSP